MQKEGGCYEYHCDCVTIDPVSLRKKLKRSLSHSYKCKLTYTYHPPNFIMNKTRKRLRTELNTSWKTPTTFKHYLPFSGKCRLLYLDKIQYKMNECPLLQPLSVSPAVSAYSTWCWSTSWLGKYRKRKIRITKKKKCVYLATTGESSLKLDQICSYECVSPKIKDWIQKWNLFCIPLVPD